MNFEFFAKIWPALMQDPLHFLLVAMIAALVAWRIKEQLSKEKFQGIQEQLKGKDDRAAAMQAQLQFADSQNKKLQANLDVLQSESLRLTQSLNQLHNLPQTKGEIFAPALDKAIETAVSVQGLANKVDVANIALSSTLAEWKDPVFEAILEKTGDNFLLGMLAYGLYKRSHEQWASKLVQTAGRKPTAEESAAFNALFKDQTEIVLSQAEQVLLEFANNVVAEHSESRKI